MPATTFLTFILTCVCVQLSAACAIYAQPGTPAPASAPTASDLTVTTDYPTVRVSVVDGVVKATLPTTRPLSSKGFACDSSGPMAHRSPVLLWTLKPGLILKICDYWIASRVRCLRVFGL